MKHLAALTLLLLTAVAAAQETAPTPPKPNTRVRFDTSMGSFVISLDAERAPMTVENFLRYVREGQYEGTIFHRVIANFVVQGGGFDTNNQLKPVHGQVVNESGNGLTNNRGTVGMARAEPAHSGTCQFYINLSNNPDLNPLPTRWGFAVFGKVVEGMDVVDRMGNTATGVVGPFKDSAPLKPIIIEKATVLE